MPLANTVGFVGDEEFEHSKEVLEALTHSCGLHLRRAVHGESSGLAGMIVLSPFGAKAAVPTELTLPSIQVIRSDAITTAAQIRFSAGFASPPLFRGRELQTESVVPERVDLPSGEIVATANGKPVWITRTSEHGLRHDTCWVSHPWIQNGECVFHHLNGSRLLNLLPILEWLRAISDWHRWQHPPLRACFMFDDPNLHASHYGFVRYDQLAAEGMRYRYHTSFATVPLDGYYVSGAAARVVRENQTTLSFLIHGNNHTYRELADRDATPAYRLAHMQEAIRRIEKLERKAGFLVSRVMAPPHGICSAEMMGAMRTAGFEAVCVSHGSVYAGNPDAKWTVSLGACSTMVVAGLPVISRFGLDRKPLNQILLAGYLHQPIIPVGHHWDLDRGTDILSSAAQAINDLGPVRWSDMSTIARSNYRYMVEGHTLRVQSFARTLNVDVPEGVSEVVVEAPWMDASEEIRGRDSAIFAALSPGLAPHSPTRFIVSAETSAEFVVNRIADTAETADRLPRTAFKTIARKVLVEVRDRAMPYLPRAALKR